jgi:hypothetical protein
LEFMKLAKIACVQVFGSIENNQCFQKERSWKTSWDHAFGFVHSILCTMLLHISKLSFEEAINWWTSTKTRYCVDSWRQMPY